MKLSAMQIRQSSSATKTPTPGRCAWSGPTPPSLGRRELLEVVDRDHVVKVLSGCWPIADLTASIHRRLAARPRGAGRPPARERIRLLSRDAAGDSGRTRWPDAITPSRAYCVEHGMRSASFVRHAFRPGCADR